MQYQLVLQFPEEKYGDIDWVINFEDFLIATLKEAEVDGHDMGVGEVNIFLNTNTPIKAFNRIKELFKEQHHGLLEDCKASYRKISSDKYLILWPSDLTSFKI